MKALALLAVAFAPVMAQTTKPVSFEIADVHVSPHRNNPDMDGGALRGDRYVMRQATMVDLISLAYSIDGASVQGGPGWLERERFDVIAKAPARTSGPQLKLMLQTLLADRFLLTTHMGSKPMPAYVLRIAKNKPALKPADPAEESRCEDKTPLESMTPGRPSDLLIACHNMTMEAFAPLIHDYAGGYLDKPVVDLTGLKEAWDFELRWTGRDSLKKAGADGISVFDAVEKQLGLTLTLETAPRAVMIVDHVNKVPTSNVAGIEKELVPGPPPQFEVATIKPGKPDAHLDGKVDGNRIDLRGATLRFLITYAFNLNGRDKQTLVGAPDWIDTHHFDILGKVAMDAEPSGPHTMPEMQEEDFQYLLRELLVERFQMKSHFEERPIDSYVLTAVKPRMAKADPMTRTHCLQGPGPDGKDPRIASPILNKLFFCQNMSMTEFGEEMQSFVRVISRGRFGMRQDWMARSTSR